MADRPTVRLEEIKFEGKGVDVVFEIRGLSKFSLSLSISLPVDAPPRSIDHIVTEARGVLKQRLRQILENDP